MKRFGPGGNFPVKVVHLQRLSSLTGRSLPFHLQAFSFPVPLQLVTIIASDARPKLSPYTQLHTRLRYSSASFFFSSGFHQFLKTNILDWLGFLDKPNLLKIPECRSFSVLKTLTGS